MKLEQEMASRVLEAALEKARDLRVAMAVAVCDQGGHLLAFARMDQAMLLAGETVQAKARAAVYFRRPTAETVERSREHPTVYNSFVEVAVAPIALSMGGIPLWDGKNLEGAVAAAGGTGEEDISVASAGAALWDQIKLGKGT